MKESIMLLFVYFYTIFFLNRTHVITNNYNLTSIRMLDGLDAV